MPAPSSRLDVALIRRHPELSRRQAREAIEKGQVSVAGQTVRLPGQPVGDDATVVWEPRKKALPRARCSLPLLYQDDSLVIIDKPAGLLTVPSAPEAAAVEDTALARVRDYVLHLRPRDPYVGVVHRIDRDTSGAICFVLDPHTREQLRELFRAHRIERRYAALVVGSPPGDNGTIDAAISDAYEAGRRHVAGPSEPSHHAVTHFRVVSRFAGATLLEVELETGRQHQIRIHLAHVGLPIVGDTVYGPAAPPRFAARRQLLHARSLGFVHPETSTAVHAESALPRDFQEALAAAAKATRPHPERPARRKR